MKKKYIKPEIELIKQLYNEGLMTTLSLGISTTPAPGPGQAKPGGIWVDAWTDPTTSSTSSTTTSTSATDTWSN